MHEHKQQDYDAATERVTTVAGAAIGVFSVGLEVDCFCVINQAW